MCWVTYMLVGLGAYHLLSCVYLKIVNAQVTIIKNLLTSKLISRCYTRLSYSWNLRNRKCNRHYWNINPKNAIVSAWDTLIRNIVIFFIINIYLNVFHKTLFSIGLFDIWCTFLVICLICCMRFMTDYTFMFS